MEEARTGGPAFGRRRLPVVLAAAAVALGVLGVALLASAVLDRPLSDFTREPQHALGGAFYVGFVSVLGVLGWWTAASAALLTAATAASERGEFLVLGLALAFLAFDDAFQLHEIVLPDIVGVPELVVYGLYAGAFAALVVRGRAFFARYDTLLAFAAGTVLALSAVIDFLQGLGMLHSRVAEESTKMTGIALVVVFTWGAAYDRLRRDGDHARLERA